MIIISAVIVACSRLMGAGKIKGYILKYGIPVIMVLSALDIVSDNSVTLNNRVALTKEVLNNNEYVGEDTAQAVEQLKSADKDYYRIEKTYSGGTYFNGSMIWGYPGVSYYIGTYNKHVQTFFRTFWPEAVYGGGELGEKYVVYQQDPANDVMNELLGIRYVLDKDGMPDVSEDMERYTSDALGSGINSNSGINVYKNRSMTGFGMLYTTVVNESDINRLDDKQSFRDKLDRCVVIEDAVIEEVEQSANGIKILSAEEIESNELTEAEHIGVYKSSDGTYTCTVSADTDTIVFMPIPYDEGWSATVNGEKARIIRADLGFIAVPLNAGNNDVILSYHTPYLMTGMIMTIVGVVIYIICFFILQHASNTALKSK